MKHRQGASFLVGFVIAVATALAFYWLLSRRRLPAITPPPIVIPARRPAAPPAPDALIEIKGIGPAYEAHLYAAGIHTFAGLARLSADRLLEIIGQRIGLAHAEEWLAEARRRSS